MEASTKVRGPKSVNGLPTQGTRQQQRIRPLGVSLALARLQHEVKRECRRGADLVPENIVPFLRTEAHREDLDTVDGFEDILNGCLDRGYRRAPVIGFVYEVLFDRFTARIRKRLSTSRLGCSLADVEDLLGVTVEAVHRLLARSNRERHSITYALLLAIADHRTIDYLRRKKAEPRDDLEALGAAPLWQGGQAHTLTPERQLEERGRLSVARRLRTAVLGVVNGLPSQQRAALIMVEVEGLGYDAVAANLGIKRTDVGNLVRRARLQRDRGLMPHLRTMGQLGDNVGFKGIQENRLLRINLLRWTAEMGDGVCAACLERGDRLHVGDEPCFAVPQAAELSPPLIAESC